MRPNVNPPLVSICIPTYNRPEYLRRVVASCLAQTYPHWQIIITDNSTNNESANLAATWTDPRIRYFKNDGNPGPTASSNRAVSMSQGKYVQLLMDDDLIKPKFLALMVAAFEENPTAGVVMAPMELIDAQDRRIFPKFYFFRTMQYRYRYQVGDGLIGRKRVLRDFLTRDYPCCVPSGVLYRAEALRPALPFDPDADFAGDLLMCMKLAAKWDFYYIDEVLSSWRLMPVNHTASLHQTGLKISVFYAITRQILAQAQVRELFHDEWGKIERDSMFFCSCRALLNGLAAMRSRSPALFLATIKTILQEDRHIINLLRLPFWAFGQVWVSIFPPKLPPARE
jgi:glycosyltransferase involved in cell wall biosynthesis